jgi:hypothetical protein
MKLKEMNNKFKNFYFFFVVISSGLSLSFFRSNDALIGMWILGMLLFGRETIVNYRKLIIALSIWSCYFIINTLIIQSFHPMFFGTYFAKIMIAHWLLNFYKKEVFFKYEDAIYRLSVISLVFYFFQLLIPDILFEFLKVIDISQNLFPNRIYASIGIYTYHVDEIYESFPRNSGFCWEPGPFSSYVVLALFINIARNGLKIRDVKRLLIFLITIISAQSSTGLVVLLAVIIWYAWSRYKNKTFRFVSMPIALLFVVILFIKVPWLQDKILEESKQDIEELLNNAQLLNSGYAPGRFASFELRWMDFLNYPIAGFGGNVSLQMGYFDKDVGVSAISGIGNILGRYGIVGTIIFIYLIFDTGKWLANRYNFSANIIFPLLILLIGFGFSIIESPILITLWLTSFFLKNKS